MTWLVNIFLFSALLPFTSPFPAPSDVQLPAFIIASIIIAIDVAEGRFTFNWIEGVFLAIAIWSLCFVLPGNPFNPRERIGMLAAFEIYYVVKKYAPLFSTRTLVIVVVITLATAVVQLTMPGVYGEVGPLFLRTTKDLSQGGRGASGPSAEPSFLAAMALVHGALVVYYYVVGRLTLRTFRATLVMSAISLLLSKSATGFMYLGLLAVIGAAYFVFRGMTVGRWAVLLVSVAVLFAVVVGPLAESRGGVLLVALYNNPERVLLDGSAQERVRCLAIGMLSLIRYPLGVGGGGFPSVALEMAHDFELYRVFETARANTVTGVLNAGGLYCAELGIIFVLFLGVVLAGSMRVGVFHLLFGALALLFLLFSFSIAFPLTWLLFGLTARRDFLVARTSTIRRAA
jgi:hypothetical protein